MISHNTIEQIKNRVDILDIIGEYVKLKKRGANYLGNCPFHNEKTPSFTVSPTKELYKCFGCGKSGNSIGFLMEHDKLSYVEALRWLANRYQIEIEETEVSPERKEQIQTADSLIILNNFAAKFFQDQLTENEEGKTIAVSYLIERGFNFDTLKKFSIGYNPQERDSLAKALIKQQFSPDLYPKSGLVVSRNEKDWVDNYRGRIIFPIHSITGKIIGFGARIIGKGDGKGPKYINTPENEVYSKSKILYGMYQARNAINKVDECLLVEGYTDVVSLHQAGIENVVASGGTSLTADQLKLIKKYTQNLTIIYDGDAAGIKAAMRGLDMALEEGLNVKLVLIPDKEDPDSYVHKIGKDAFNDFIATKKKDFIIFQLEIMLAEAGNDINKKNDVVNHICETLSKITKQEDFLKLSEYIRRSSTLLKIDEAALTNLINKYRRDKIVKEDKKMSFDEAAYLQPQEVETAIPEQENLIRDEDQDTEYNLLKVLLEYGLKPYNDTITYAEFIFDELLQFNFDIADLEQVYEAYKTAYYDKQEPDSKWLLYHENSSFRSVATNISIEKYELNERWYDEKSGLNFLPKDNSMIEVVMSICYFKLRKIKKMTTQNQQEMETADFDKQMQMMEVHKHLKLMEKEITEQLGTVILK